MKTKLLSIFIIGLFIAVAFQINTVTSESESKEEIKDTGINSFASCYIEVSGNIATIDWPRIIGTNMWKLIYFRPFFNDFAVVVFWRLVLDESTELSIYNKQGGDLLWQHEGLGYPLA
jgi:hypothetical protein